MSKRNTKAEIFKEAARLFHEKGYSATSVRAIATAVGIEASSLYSHIQSKAEILENICLDIALQFTTGIKEIDSLPVTPMSKLELILNQHIDMAIEEPQTITAFNQEWRHLEGEALKKFKRMRKQYEKVLLSIISEGQNEQKIKPIDKEIILNTMLSSLRWLYFTKPSHLKRIKSDLQFALKDIFLTGTQLS